jgi:hypothetical protein
MDEHLTGENSILEMSAYFSLSYGYQKEINKVMNNTMCIYQLFNDINEIANIKADIV